MYQRFDVERLKALRRAGWSFLTVALCLQIVWALAAFPSLMEILPFKGHLINFLPLLDVTGCLMFALIFLLMGLFCLGGSKSIQ